MEGRPFFSVIMPVHNSERTLARAVESVLSQEGANWELLLIVNGSRDKSAAIAGEYAARCHAVRLFETERAGVSAARNLGLEEARGAYAVFCDDDDRCLPGALRAMAEALAEPCDALVGFVRQEGKCSGALLQADPKGLYLALLDAPRYTAAAHPALAGRRLPLISPWAKAFRLDFLRRNGLRFDARYPVFEDLAFVRSCFRAMGSARVLDRELYEYVLRPDSLSKRSDITYMRDVAAAVDLLRAEEPSSPEEKDAVDFLTFRVLTGMVRACATSQAPECLDFLRETLRRDALREALCALRDTDLDVHPGVSMVLSLVLRALRSGDAAEAARRYEVLVVPMDGPRP